MLLKNERIIESQNKESKTCSGLKCVSAADGIYSLHLLSIGAGPILKASYHVWKIKYQL